MQEKVEAFDSTSRIFPKATQLFVTSLLHCQKVVLLLLQEVFVSFTVAFNIEENHTALDSVY